MTEYFCTGCDTGYEGKQDALDCCEDDKCLTKQDKSGEFQG